MWSVIESGEKVPSIYLRFLDFQRWRLPSSAKDKHVSERSKQTQPGAISRDTRVSLILNNLRTEVN